MGFFLFFVFFLPTCEGKCCSQPKTSVRSWFTLQSLQTSFKWTGASFDSGGAAVVLGWPYLLIIISATASLIAVKKGGRPSRRQGQLMMTRDDLQLLTSCRSCAQTSKLAGKTSGPRAVSLNEIYLFAHSTALFVPPIIAVINRKHYRERCDFRFS